MQTLEVAMKLDGPILSGLNIPPLCPNKLWIWDQRQAKILSPDIWEQRDELGKLVAAKQNLKMNLKNHTKMI